ncbi:MAG TPA: hypothetical protein VFY48_02390 [Solirubrobacterales bacterium]|nr:hypothetical protein [Solirubrobacterales bacterium]
MNEPSVKISEGRARWARPSLCVSVLALALALTVLVSPAAQAVPPKPVLTGTNPASPGISLRPRVKGLADEVITSVVRFGAFGGGRAPLAVNPANEVVIYAGDPTCLDPGAIVGEGIAEELEDTGILVDEGAVAEDSVTTFYATQEDETGVSSCSAGLKYRQVTTPPDPPELEAVTPASPANDNFPRLTGSVDPDASVSVYSNASCTGAPLATGTATDFTGSGVQSPVADNTTTTFHASATLAGLSSGCSNSSISYQEVTPSQEPPKEEPGGGGPGGKGSGGDSSSPNPPGKPPAPKLRTLPAGIANDNTPLVTGSAPGAAKVEVFAEAGCKGPVLAKGPVAEFDAGLPVEVVDNTAVTFYGASIDGGGDRSPCSSAPVIYIEDSTRPLTRITMGPGVKTRKRTAVFRFLDSAGEAPGTTYFCKLDRRKWRPCATPFRAKRLSRRSHVFQVKAVDPAGNREVRPAKRRFKVVR